jgi:hypothetical protein
MKKTALAFIVVVVLGIVAALAAGPYMTLGNIRKGVATSDQDLLTANVDFPVLRENLKVQLKASFDKAMAPDENDSEFQKNLSTLGGDFVEKLTNKMVDALITPAGMARMAGRSFDLSPQPAEPEPEKNKFLADAHVEFDSINSAHVIAPGQEGSKDVAFVLTRQGFSWKLTNVVLPLESAPAGDDTGDDDAPVDED